MPKTSTYQKGHASRWHSSPQTQSTLLRRIHAVPVPPSRDGPLRQEHTSICPIGLLGRAVSRRILPCPAFLVFLQVFSKSRSTTVAGRPGRANNDHVRGPPITHALVRVLRCKTSSVVSLACGWEGGEREWGGALHQLFCICHHPTCLVLSFFDLLSPDTAETAVLGTLCFAWGERERE